MALHKLQFTVTCSLFLSLEIGTHLGSWHYVKIDYPAYCFGKVMAQHVVVICTVLSYKLDNSFGINWYSSCNDKEGL